MTGKKTIGVDFDKTLTRTEQEYQFGDEKPNWPVINWVHRQYMAGHTIIVWTARPWSEANIIAARLIEWDVPFHGIRCCKGGADVYVDDKAVNHNRSGWETRADAVMAAQSWENAPGALATDGGSLTDEREDENDPNSLDLSN